VLSFPFGRALARLLAGLLLVLLLFYGVWFLWFYFSGVSFWDSLLWFRSSRLDFRFLFYFSFLPLLFSYVLGAGVVLLFCVREVDEVSRYENLQGLIVEAENRLSGLEGRERELQGEVRALEEKKAELESSIEGLDKRRLVLRKDVEELEAKAGRLNELIERAVKEGRERGYRSVITELRSLRAQKSALVDLFTREKELRETFRRVTGKKFFQFLKEVKNQVKEIGERK